MFFQDAPPDTSAYMIAGYAVFFLISAIYLLSLALRRRNLEKDLEVLQSIGADGGRAAPRGPGGRLRPGPVKRRAARKKGRARK